MAAPGNWVEEAHATMANLSAVAVEEAAISSATRAAGTSLVVQDRRARLAKGRIAREVRS